MISLIQLTYIVAVDNYRHFATAAQHCFVTQPTLSLQIQKMEDELGVLIFDRSSQPVVPTEIGRPIIKQARHILQETKRLEEIIAIHSNDISGQFRLGVIPTVAPYLLPLFLESFLCRYPQLDLIIDEIQTDQIIDKLKKEELDLGIMATPLNREGLIEKPLYYEPFVGYVSKGHRLFSKEKITPEDLRLDDLFLLKEGHCFRGHTVQLCLDRDDNNDVSRKSLRFEGGNLDTLKKLVEKNFGMTLLPYLATNELIGKPQYENVREFQPLIPKREISLVYLRAYLKKHIINVIEEEILKCIPAELKEKGDGLMVE